MGVWVCVCVCVCGGGGGGVALRINFWTDFVDGFRLIWTLWKMFRRWSGLGQYLVRGTFLSVLVGAAWLCAVWLESSGFQWIIRKARTWYKKRLLRRWGLRITIWIHHNIPFWWPGLDFFMLCKTTWRSSNKVCSVGVLLVLIYKVTQDMQ